jgi:hypothetical protein
MVGSDMTPSFLLKQSLSGAVYSGSSTSSWSKLGLWHEIRRERKKTVHS